MALLEQDFTIEQGSTFLLEFVLRNDDNTPLGLTVQNRNVSNEFLIGEYSFRMKMRKSKYRGTSTYSLSNTSVLQVGDKDLGKTADSFYIISEDTGKVWMLISPSSTSAIKHGKYFFDIEAVKGSTASEEVIKVLSGKFVVTAEATN